MEGAFDNSVAQIVRTFLGFAIENDFDADHQSDSAHGADDRVAFGPGGDAREDVIANTPGVRHVLRFDQANGFERGGHGNQIAAERGCVGAGRPIHDIGAGDGGGKRHAGSDSLRDAQDIWLDSGVISGPPFACAAHAALHFVGDQENAVLAAQRLKLTQKFCGRGQVAAFALNGLDDDAGDVFRRDDFVEQFALDERAAFGAVAAGGGAVRTAIRIGIRRVENAGEQRAESFALHGL